MVPRHTMRLHSVFSIALLALVFALREATAASSPVGASGVTLSLESRGVAIKTPADGELVLEYPTLTDAAQKLTPPTGVTVRGNTASMRYADGASLTATLDNGSIMLHFTALPAAAKGMRMEMPVPIAFKDGGKFQLEGAAAKPFPAEHAGEQFVFKGNPTPVKLIGPKGGAFTITMPYGWQQMQDNRKWNTDSFGYMLATDLGRTGSEAYYTFKVLTGDEKPTPALKLAPVAARPAPTPKTWLSVRLSNNGVAIDAGGLGSFTLEYPVLIGDRWDKVRKPIETSVAGNTAAIKFDAGARIDVALQGGELTLTPVNLPGDAKSIRLNMLIDFNISNGGTWKAGAGADTPFPAEKPAKPHLLQGNADSFTLKSFEGGTLTFAVPAGSFHQLTDNREWGWKIFAWQVSNPCFPGSGPFKVKITSTSPAPGAAKTLVDRFGQNTRMDYPDKVKSEDELKKDIAAEAEYLASLHPPERDAFGGLPGSKEKLGLKQTGFFHVEKRAERWILVDPAGNAFFHLGLCGFGPSDDYTYVKGREHIYEWLPAHDSEFKSTFHPNSYWNPDVLSFHLVNTIRKFGRAYTSAEFTARTIERVRKWGFNSAGAFGAGDDGARRTAQFPHVSSLPLSTWEGFADIPGAHGSFDPFDEKIRERCEKNFAEKLPARADDPLLIGYFLNNEPLYEDLPRAIPALDGKHPCKRRLAQMLEEKYKSIAEFNRAWETTFASFADVTERGLPVKTRAASADVQEFTGLFLDTYFRLVTETFRKYDKNHLLIGNRLQSGTINNEQLCRLSGKYLDVVSFNYYTYHLDTDFLKRIHGWTGGRPMFLSEFYYSSPKDSGLPGGGKDVGSQTERGLGYRNYVEQAAALGFVVGIEWFTLIDQSFTGRFFDKYNGENGNTGILSVTDRPWKPMLAEMMKCNYDIYAVQFGERAPFHYDDPRFRGAGGRKVAKIARATGPITINGLAANWPGTPAETISASRRVQGADAAGLEASFKLCWNDANLYVLAHVSDATPMKNENKSSSIANGDAIELFIGHEQPDQAGPLLASDRRLLFSAGQGRGASQWHLVNTKAQPACQLSVTADVDGKGYTLEAAIPFAALGFVPKEGDEILFDLAVDDSADGQARARQLMWNGTARNATERTAWARAAFAK